MLHCYSQLVHTIGSGEGEGAVAMAIQGDDKAAVTQTWIETMSYLLGRKELSADVWTMVSAVYGIDKKNWRILIWQLKNFNSPPNFPAMHTYMVHCHRIIMPDSV